VLRGASTITQQVAKNLYMSPSRNPLRKLKEAVTAWRLERALGKPRILELYLNIAELGDGIWGVEAASRRYYNRSARRLTETQAAALAATLPFPLRSNPGYRPNRMRRRQDLILRRMRGERIEVPPVEEEPLLQPGDTIQWTPGIDSLLDSLRAPVETLPPGSIETPPASPIESLSIDSIAPPAPVPFDSSAPTGDATPRGGREGQTAGTIARRHPEHTEARQAARSTPLSP
jgi:monofunctional biosynthetic peptidoglycan transglycosylase